VETLVPRAVARFYYRHPMDAILTELLAATGIAPVARVLAAPNTVARLALPHTLPVVGVTFLLVMTQDPPRAGGGGGRTASAAREPLDPPIVTWSTSIPRSGSSSSTSR
jgi:hypothetical protein